MCDEFGSSFLDYWLYNTALDGSWKEKMKVSTEGLHFKVSMEAGLHKK